MAGSEGACGKVLVVDDDAGMLRLVTETLEASGLAVTTADGADAAVAALAASRPDVVIIDVNMPRVSGYELCRRVKEEDRSLPVVFLSGERTESYDRVAGLLLGADDYLVKPFAPDELVARIRCVLRRAVTQARQPATSLTKRELEILRLLAGGRSQRQIAVDLMISPKTVGTHIEHILEKLGVRSRSEAIALAYRDALVQPAPA